MEILNLIIKNKKLTLANMLLGSKFTLRTDVLFPCVRMSGHWSAHVEGRGQKNGVTYSTYAGQRIKVAKCW